VSPDRPGTQLFLLRHADAGDPAAWQGPDDARPLSEKGRLQAERLGSFLSDIGFRPDAIIASPKVRAQETADIVAEALGVAVRLDDRLAGAVDLRTVEAVIRDAGEPARPMLVGHDPDFSELLNDLASASGLAMKKGALARVDIRGRVADGRGSLRWLVPPDLLDRERA
jgi:phosphohistidine phosphatase